MTKVIIIHGSFGSPTENWFPWLKQRVVEAGQTAFVPTFPTPEQQSLENWRTVFEQQVGTISRDCLLVGHSLGVAFIFDLLERSIDPVRASFFVSGFVGELGDPQFDNVNRSFVCRDFDWKKIRSNMGKAFLYHGDTDPYVPLEKCKELSKRLQVKPNLIKNGGHLNAAAGYETFDALWSDLAPLLS
jgi:predicted alpha/beta hydrolase family esterase